MATSYKDLLAQREALEKKIAEARSTEVTAVVEKIRQLMADYGLSVADIAPEAKKKTKSNSPVAAKYRNPKTGETWTGRGKPPAWIRDQDRANFAI